MKQRDVLMLMDGIAPAIAGLIGKALAPVLARLEVTENELAAAKAELAERPDFDGIVAREVAKALAEQPPVPTAEDIARLVPAGRDGIDGKDGAPGIPGEKGLDGKDGAPGADGRDGIDGKDGVGLASALIDRDGNLVLTMTNGATKSLGLVVGKDGLPGKPGDDGFSLDDFEVIDAEDSFTLRFVRGDKTKEFTLAKPTLADFYRGVWKEGSHKAGAVVTWGGSIWLAKRDTEDRPESSDAWTLIVKKGRDGRDGEAPKGPAKVKL